MGERILDVATQLFLADGYGATSIEAVASRAGISKRTFYHRFDGKAALFAAVVHRVIERIRPPPSVPLIEGATLAEILRRLAGFMLAAALAPEAIALHRLITAESARFPELARAVVGEGSTQEATSLIAGLLERDGLGSPDSRAVAAEQFIDMVIAVPQRRALGLGVPMTPAELARWADAAVELFLNGCAGPSPRSRATPAV